MTIASNAAHDALRQLLEETEAKTSMYRLQYRMFVYRQAM